MENISYQLKTKKFCYAKLNSKMFVLEPFDEIRISRKHGVFQIKINDQNIVFTSTLSNEEIKKLNCFVESVSNNNEKHLNIFKNEKQTFSIKKHTLFFSKESGFSFWLNLENYEYFIDFDLIIETINSKILH